MKKALVAGIVFAIAVIISVLAGCETDRITGAPSSAPSLLTTTASSGPEQLPASCPAGTVVEDSHHYVRVVCGTSRFVIDAPHDGTYQPAGVPVRTFGTLGRDTYTSLLAKFMSDSLTARTGQRPCTVIMLLARKYVDANRPFSEGTDGNREQERAWINYHGFLRQCVDRSYAVQGKRILDVDVHNNGHTLLRIDWGWGNQTAWYLNQSDSYINGDSWYWKNGSFRYLYRSDLTHVSNIRGSHSIGGVFAAMGVRSIPSPADPRPGSNHYYGGAYITRAFGCPSSSAKSCSVQMENPYAMMDTDSERRHTASVSSRALPTFLSYMQP